LCPYYGVPLLTRCRFKAGRDKNLTGVLLLKRPAQSLTHATLPEIRGFDALREA
jgi:hypothetical protein